MSGITEKESTVLPSARGQAPDVWYLADKRGRTGPLSLRELKDTLATLPNVSQVLVWARHLPDWKRINEVPELTVHIHPPSDLGLFQSDQIQRIGRQAIEARTNYIVRHWRGELSLPLSYWVNGVALSLAATFITDVVILYMKPTASEVIALLAAFLGFFLDGHGSAFGGQQDGEPPRDQTAGVGSHGLR
jgi:hypothetical protein